MAVAEILTSQLQLVFNDGNDTSTGKPVYKTKNFNNVKTSANADQLYAVALAFADLQERPLYTISRKDSTSIAEG
ncbi:hypothetical protein JOC34_002537 [Virgibacillus halotolerans]|uniref:DUF1659 domain-containing protein n=1 Tax=Virgibacillus halotolerans TaxID=1071053 RepID=UPI0019600B5D|nr:DUF1659 domain-containing protein [Virgibacillus halotolerans]MBM7600146.1 hypothetical protein [Virgibacillus halotolerans]